MRVSGEAAVDDYLAAWNERDANLRRALLERALTDDCEFEGPTGTFRGRPAIDGLIVALQDRIGDAVVTRRGPVEADLRFGWALESAAGVVLLEGVDEVEASGDGRLRRVAVSAHPNSRPAPKGEE